MMAVFLHTAAQQRVVSGAEKEQSPIEKYPYVLVLAGDTAIELTDSMFYNISRKVIFPVNKYTIPKSSDFRREIEEELMPYMNDSSYVLDRVVIRGAASPEGPYRWNRFLAEHRAKALIGLIGKNSTIGIEQEPSTSLMAEDYVYLLLLMKERGDKDHALVERIVKRWIDRDWGRLKAQLINYDGGKLWSRLLREYFPELRAARVVLIFKKYNPLRMYPPKADEASVLEPENKEILMPSVVPPPLAESFVPDIRLPRREWLSVKTNLLLDFAYMPGYKGFCPIPNVAIEYYPLHGHFTYGASFDCPWWQNSDKHKYFQVRNYQLEARYYFRSGDIRKRHIGEGAAFSKWYLQAYGHLGLFGIGFDERRGWIGEGAGAGLGVGYVLPLGKREHWRLEFGAQFGYFWAKYDPFRWKSPIDPDLGGNKYYYKWMGDPDLFKKRQYRFRWFGPTRVGVTLSYDLLYRKAKGKGVSFRSSEKRKSKR